MRFSFIEMKMQYLIRQPQMGEFPRFIFLSDIIQN